MGGVRFFQADLARRLVLHEARAQQTPGRELRDLGDGWLFHDPNDAEPFWNRLIAPAWPDDRLAFDRRLDEVITLFSTLGRLPHVRPLPVGGTPDDIADRLSEAGFQVMGADRRMVLADPGDIDGLVSSLRQQVERAFGGGSDISVSRQESRRGGGLRRGDGNGSWGDRRRWAVDASLVLSDAFGVDPERRVALEHDVLACVSRPGCAVILVAVDGVPAAIARRATTGEGSYLSSIGTRPGFRGHGLGALVTALAVRDALSAGSSLVHLAAEQDNAVALRLYARLGFALVGEAAPDMLLR